MPPNLTGYYRFVSQENMDNYLRALDINVVLRKVVCLLKPDKEIIHTGNHMVIRTITSLRDYVMDFDLGVQFEEDLGPVDGRKCQTTVSWEGDQLVCEQLGEKRNRGWRHWLEGDKLHLVRTQLAKSQLQWVGDTDRHMTVEDEVCVQVFQKVK
ncbi:retinol-binding protein 5 isoform X1 [Falco naumanni]|uniref:retinol-binding protein 5 isoform X1 n=1 Tax=Falco naumanni TaxID=148594 RepID=UPI001ADEA15B|nr:retinol-binding protein 5 isoform X1 [Falco naumanni]